VEAVYDKRARGSLSCGQAWEGGWDDSAGGQLSGRCWLGVWGREADRDISNTSAKAGTYYRAY
jgi:hypothetical protein